MTESAPDLGREMTATAHASGVWFWHFSELSHSLGVERGIDAPFRSAFRFALPKFIIGITRASWRP